MTDDWPEAFKSCFKSENHLIALRQMYEGPKLLDEFKLNKKTAYRILNHLYNKGLVGRQGERICLTNKGMLLCCMAFGDFKDFKPTNIESDDFEFKEAYIERKEIVARILYNAQRKISTAIIAESGMGKTTMLKHLKANYLKNSTYSTIKPIKAALEAMLKNQGIEPKKGMRINDMISLIKKNSPQALLLIDEMESSTNQASKTLKELKRAGTTIIGAGQYIKDLSIFQDKIRLKGLSSEEAQTLIAQLLKGKYENTQEIERIAQQSTNNSPEQIADICKTAISLKKFNEQSTLQSKINPTNKKINIISTNALINIAYLLLTLRYIYYGQREFQIGYILSTIGYLIFFFFKRRK